MSKVGPVDTYLSLKVERGPKNEVYLSQQHYIQHVIDSHLPTSASLTSVPCNTLFADLTAQKDEPQTNQPYSELIGMLQWLANGTRPDIQFAINCLSQFLQHPTEAHWTAAIHVLKYLKSTKSLRLCLGTAPSKQLHGYTDADWASTSEDR